MAESQAADAAQNESIVAALRETFSLVTERLTPDIEPAAVYVPSDGERDNEA
ncbi:MAG: hypothetical protein JO091_13325 [Acidobacteriaceae bacterium]|nr:hypothetical protein [Acidobacteriaceae bacterium]